MAAPEVEVLTPIPVALPFPVKAMQATLAVGQVVPVEVAVALERLGLLLLAMVAWAGLVLPHQ